MNLDRSRFADPLYTITEAASIVKIPATTLAMWARGYVRRPTGRPEIRGEPIITSVGKPRRNQPLIPFVGLAEATVLAAIRKTGVPMQRIRPAIDQMQRGLGLPHALAHERLSIDGPELLHHFSKRHRGEAAGRVARRLLAIRGHKCAFAEAIENCLQGFQYSKDGYVELFRVPAYRHAEVVVDPARSSGAPIFVRGGCRVEDVLHRFWAGESLKELTVEFRVPGDHIEDAIRVASRSAA